MKLQVLIDVQPIKLFGIKTGQQHIHRNSHFYFIFIRVILVAVFIVLDALLHILEPAKGLAIPVLLCTDVMNAQEGLLIFDPELNALSLFDGLGWKIVK